MKKLIPLILTVLLAFPAAAQQRAVSRAGDAPGKVRRYLESDDLDAMIVVTQRVTRLPDAICGKPVCLVSLNRLWGVALP